ncbi:MAG: carbohydrate kinase family protein [Minwuia sp.]|nr:carbohydrate kinase family protein [Minwuia sp.]
MKALTVGGAMIDTIALIDSDRIERMALSNADTGFLLLEEGRKTEARDISAHCGGGAVNAAVAMARLGLDTASLIKLGQDRRAEQVLTRLSDEGVSTRFALRDGRLPTGASVMVAAHDRNAAIFTFRGANTLLAPSDLRDDAFATDLVYISGLSNESAACFGELVRRAAAAGAMVATNPGLRQLTARQDAFYDCLDGVSILSINRAEGDALVPSLISEFGEGGTALPLDADQPPLSLIGRGFTSGGFQMSARAFFQAILSRGPAMVLVTAGRDGSYLADADGLRHCPVMEVEVAGTAGAGDAFGSTFAALTCQGMPVDDALRGAAINAASVVAHIDTQTGLLDHATLTDRIAASRKSLPIRFWSWDEAGREQHGGEGDHA